MNAQAETPRDRFIKLINQYPAIFATLQPFEQDVLSMRFGLQDGISCSMKALEDHFKIEKREINEITVKAFFQLLKAEKLEIKEFRKLADQAFDEKNYEKSFEYCTKAAEKGDANAQYNLGQMYYTGTGTDKNLRTASKLFMSAAQKKHPQAAEILNQLHYSSSLPLQLAFPTEQKENKDVVVFIKHLGKDYHYYMTNNTELLKKKLLQLNYRLPVLTDFKPNPDLADEVIETMESLNMCFSMETQTANVLNYYMPQSVPFIYRLIN